MTVYRLGILPRQRRDSIFPFSRYDTADDERAFGADDAAYRPEL